MRNLSRLLFGSLVLILFLFGCRTNEKNTSKAVTLSEENKKTDMVGELGIESVDKVKMCVEKDSTLLPFFRVKLNVKDKAGKPQNIKIDEKTFTDQITVQGPGDSGSGDKNKYQVLFVSNPPEPGKSVTAANIKGREILLLLDISGSMVGKNNLINGETRLKAAQNAARVLLENFRDGIDRISVVPFESRKVEEKIRQATFAETKVVAENQINQLSQPDPQHANTALYSATAFALDKLKNLESENNKREPILIVLTDGKNETEKGDDPGLWGAEGLDKVKEKASVIGIPIWTIGLGKAGMDYDSKVLEQMVYPKGNKQFFSAQDANDLRSVLATAEEALSNRLTVTFFPTTSCDYKKINKLDFKVRLNLSGKQISSNVLTWTSATASGTSFDDRLTTEELKALSKITIKNSCAPVDPWKQFLGTLGILSLFSGGFAFLWFIPPRLMWPRISNTPGSIKKLLKKKPPVPKPVKPPVVGKAPQKSRERFEETTYFDRGKSRKP